MMMDCNCGEIPVVESQQTMKPTGIVTDRDIACRAGDYLYGFYTTAAPELARSWRPRWAPMGCGCIRP